MIESAEEFVRLRTSEDIAEYQRSAHDAAPDEVWFDVIERYPEMREWVALNKSISEQVIRRLFDTGDRKTLYFLAMKRKTPSDLLLQLCTEADESIRLRLAHHPKLPPAAIEILAKDDWEEVREVIQKRRDGK